MTWTHEDMAARAARELRDGDFVELGFGIPTLVANQIPDGMEIWIHSDAGVPGMGLYPTDDYMDAEFIDAGRPLESNRRKAVPFHSSHSFAAMLSPSADIAIVEAESIDAGWSPVETAKRIVVMMEHTERRQDGSEHPRIFSVPASAKVSRIITNIAVLEVTPAGMKLLETADGVSREHVQSSTAVALL